MRCHLETWSTWAFRIVGLSLVALVASMTFREQNHPVKIDLRDATFEQKMEDFVRRQKACKVTAQAESEDDPMKPGRPTRWSSTITSR
jgi:hypothetical protein